MADDYFKGKIAFVTGAATKMGMGRAIALQAGRGWGRRCDSRKFAKPMTNFPGAESWRGLEEELKEIKAFGVGGACPDGRRGQQDGTAKTRPPRSSINSARSIFSSIQLLSAGR